jgi:hypothetical protein
MIGEDTGTDSVREDRGESDNERQIPRGAPPADRGRSQQTQKRPGPMSSSDVPDRRRRVRVQSGKCSRRPGERPLLG